ncbi:MAG: transposase [Clostridia bacterium]|nr:transposase [Clostridia bacterium]
MLEHERKRLRLKDYDYSKTGAYFVTVCVNNRGSLLLENPEAKEMIEKWILKIEDKFVNTKIDCYAIMKDHIHLIVFINDQTETSLPVIMEWFKTMTTNEYIKGVRAQKFEAFEKKFWQRSYNDHIIRNEKDLEEKRQYILNNPIKEALKSNA